MYLPIILSVLVFLPISSFATVPILTTDQKNQYQQMVLTEVNQYRKSKGLNPLKLNSAITYQAKQHSNDMAAHKMPVGHQDFDKRVAHIQNHVTEFGGGAENVAIYKSSPHHVVEEWLKSPGHKSNIEGHYNLTGIGVAQDEKGWIYYTQIFIEDRQAAV
tara:strand:- start:23612 stop:24091 length:480 start_codon:yes stop_codon:yes gene_type:complete